jgi:hypothetical protein
MDAREIAWHEDEQHLGVAKALGADISHRRKDCQEMPSEMYERLFGEKKANFSDSPSAPDVAATEESQAPQRGAESN